MSKTKSRAKRKTRRSLDLRVMDTEELLATSEEADMVDTEDLAVTPGERIRSVAHGFRLQFHGLGHQRKLSETQYAVVAKELETDPSSLGLVKYLYDLKLDVVARLNQAKSQAKLFFQAHTLPFPELAVRLLPVHAETEEGRREEIRAFCQGLRDKLAEFEARRAELKAEWPKVLKHNRDRLKKLFSAGDYPTAEQVEHAIQAHFEPYNFALPTYLKHVDPEEYRRCRQQLEEKFKLAADMQASAVAAAVSSGLESMIESIQGYHDGRKKCFHGNSIAKVFRALEVFRANTERYGILAGSEITEAFSQLDAILREGALDAESLPDALRGSAGKRADLLQKTSGVMAEINGLLENAPSRKLIRQA